MQSTDTLPADLSDHQKRRSLPALFSGNFFGNIFVVLTVFGTFFTLFLNDLGMDKARIGIILSLLPLCNILAPLFGPIADRFGLKQTFMFTGITGVVLISGIVMIPWVLAHYGKQAAFGYIVAVMIAYAVLRTVGITASMPWTQQLIPSYLLGKFNATCQVLGGLAAMGAAALGSWLIARIDGTNGYIVIFAIGLTAGIISMLSYVTSPRQVVDAAHVRPSYLAALGHIGIALRDRHFIRFLSGIACISLGWGAVASFAPLYFTEKIGLSVSQTTMLQFFATAGSMSSAMIWGWAADRYGARPVTLAGLAGLILLPVAWFLLPRESHWSFAATAACSILTGLAVSGHSLGASRYLFANVVPRQYSTAYMAVWTGGIGLMAGIAPLAAGPLLEACSGLNFHRGPVHIDMYTPLLACGLILMCLGLAVLRPLRSGGNIRTGAFVGMFFQGNPFLALESLLRYRFAGTESYRANTAQKLGLSRTALGQNELIASMTDPSFNVRYEAVVSAAHLRPGEELIAALGCILTSPQAELAAAAAWSLGKLGDARAMVPLRDALNASHPVVRGAAARALGRLNDQDSAEMLRQAFTVEQDPDAAMALASAVGQLGCTEALPGLGAFLERLDDQALRSEAALAIARTIGDEAGYVKLWRAVQRRASSELAGIVDRLVKKSAGAAEGTSPARESFIAMRDHLQRDDTARAFAVLAELDGQAMESPFDELMAALKAAMVRHPDRMEYPTLLLHLIRTCMV